METITMHPYDKGHPRGWVLDLSEPETLSAWLAVAARLAGTCAQAGGLASLLLDDRGAGPTPDGRENAAWHQLETHLPMLISSTREIDIFGAMVAALPLVATGQGPASSWRSFLAGYACGLKTSPSLDVRRTRFLCEFDNAIAATGTHADPACLGGNGYARRKSDATSWASLVLEAISYGNVTLAALLAQRVLKGAPGSSADTVLGALLGGALWRGCTCESELIGRLCGAPTCFLLPGEVTR